MKNSLIQLSAVLGLLGTSFLGAATLGSSSAIALPESEVLKQLESIPVFTITNDKGYPILASLPNNKDGVQLVTFFVSQPDAQALLKRIQTSDPKVGSSAKVLPISLREAYKLAKDNKSNQNKIAFQFLPAKQEVDSALALLKQKGQNVQQFNDVPVFYGLGGKDKNKGLLTVKQGDRTVIPFFFNKQDLQGMLNQLKQQNSSVATTTQIEVTSLSQVVDSMLKEKDPAVGQITFVPPAESIAFVRSQKASSTKAPAPKP